MTDAISQYAQLAKLDRYAGKAGDKPAKADASSAAGASVSASLAGSKAVVTSPLAGTQSADVALNMSKVIERAKQEPDFDRVKVDAIRESIKNGQYPLDVRRMAESFVAIEQLIGK
jgi:flagellar biosynthesis anti-sigma factor FlgM